MRSKNTIIKGSSGGKEQGKKDTDKLTGTPGPDLNSIPWWSSFLFSDVKSNQNQKEKGEIQL